MNLCRDVDETLRLVQAFQFTDEHGEVCPAGWRPGILHPVVRICTSLDPDPHLEFFLGVDLPQALQKKESTSKLVLRIRN